MSSEQRWVVDDIQEGMASIELPNGKMITLPASILPRGVEPGQIVRVSFEIDEAATKKAIAESAAQVKKGRDASRKRDPGGDIVL